METITIKRTTRGYWYKRFDAYETNFTRISEAEALESLELARLRHELFLDDKDYGKDMPLVYGYYN